MDTSRLLHACLEDLERRLDPAVEDALVADYRAFLDGQWAEDVFTPRRARAVAPGVTWPAVDVNAALDDPDLLALQQYADCSGALAAGNGRLPVVRANYGVGILPSLFGAEIRRLPVEMQTLPTSRPLAGLDAIHAVLDRGVPDVHAGLGGACLAMYERFRALGERYPHLGHCVWPYHPDLQGPIDACELLWGSDLFVALIDTPDLVHALLDLITETYLAFFRAWQAIIPPREVEYAAHWGFLHRGQLVLRDDSAMNLSPALFDEFIAPYDARLLAACGGGIIHFCGRGEHYIAAAAALPGLTGINMSQPEYNAMETIYTHTVDRGLALLDLPRFAVDAAQAAGRPLRGRVLCF